MHLPWQPGIFFGPPGESGACVLLDKRFERKVLPEWADFVAELTTRDFIPIFQELLQRCAHVTIR